jgi:polyphenol oxidase
VSTAEQNDAPEIVFDSTGLLLHSTRLLDLAWLRHATTTRQFSPPDANKLEELRRLQQMLGVPQSGPIVYAQQKHTANVGLVDDEILRHWGAAGRFIFKETDAIVCPRAGVMIAVFTADCVPVVIADTRKRSVAIVHAGWQGTLGRVTAAAVQTLLESGSRPENLIAWVGPAAGACCYEVSPELVARFEDEFFDAATAGLTFSSGRMLDIPALNAWQLISSGVAPRDISMSGVCTIHEKERFYSYRADGNGTGRIITAACIV